MDNIHALQALLTENPAYIPVNKAASFLHMDANALRASIEQGRCPFGFSWKLGERAGFKAIPHRKDAE